MSKHPKGLFSREATTSWIRRGLCFGTATALASGMVFATPVAATTASSHDSTSVENELSAAPQNAKASVEETEAQSESSPSAEPDESNKAKEGESSQDPNLPSPPPENSAEESPAPTADPVAPSPAVEEENAAPLTESSDPSDLEDIEREMSALTEVPRSVPGTRMVADGGSGRFKEVIDWAEWGPRDRRIDNSSDVTWTKPTAAGDGSWFSTRCEISQVNDKTPAYPVGYPIFPGEGAGGANPEGPANPLKAYRPGSWSGDALDDLYNVGGTGTSNTLVNAIAVDEFSKTYPIRRYDVTVEFQFDCAGWLIDSSSEPELGPASDVSSYTSVPLGGLVFADAESNNWLPLDSYFNGSQREYIKVTPNHSADNMTWRLLDSYRSDGCETNSVAEILDTDGTLRFRSDDVQCATAPGATSTSQGPASVMFLEGTTSATVEVRGGGQGAVALGALLSIDFGDAPESYGSAAALFQPEWEGGAVDGDAVQNLSSMKDSGQVAEARTPKTILGKTIDGELKSQYSDNADGDDLSATDDEDGITFSQSENGHDVLLPELKDGTYTFAQEVECIGPGEVAAWVDWNRNGAFDSDEKSSQVPCESGKAKLTWILPEDTVRSVEGETGSNATFMRVRITNQTAADGSVVAIPATGITTVSGEVEDYKVDVILPRTADLVLQKMIVPADAPENSIEGAVPAGDDWEFAIPEDWELQEGLSITPAQSLTDENGRVEAEVVLSNNLAEGEFAFAETQKPGFEVVQVEGKNAVCTDADTESQIPLGAYAGSTTHPAFSSTISAGQSIICTVYNRTLTPGELEVSKSSDPESGTVVTPGQTVSYTLTFENTGEQNISVNQDDVLTDVLDDAELIGAPVAESPLVAELNSEGHRIRITGELEPGDKKTVTYQVKIKDPLAETSNAVLGNFVVDPGDNPPGTCEPDEPCTVHPIEVSLSWNKVDESGNALKGSEWILIPVDSSDVAMPDQGITVEDCIAGEASECAGPDTDPNAGTFSLKGLVTGKYLLVETKAPAGYQLLEDAIELVVNTNLEFGDIENEQSDVPTIPLTGGIGSYLFTGAALACVAAVIAALLFQRRRARFQQ